MSNSKRQGKLIAFMGMAVLAAGCTWALAQREESPISAEEQTARAGRLEAMREMGEGVALTIYPVGLPDVGQVSGDVRDAVGLLLEQGGMTSLTPVEATHKGSGELDLEGEAADFAGFVRERGGNAGYALLVSIGGTHETGPDEVRGIVVNVDGQVVWAEQLDSADRAFRKLSPKEPMTCCDLITRHLLDALDIARPKQTSADGYFAELWQRKSGTPDRAERDAMVDRLADLRAKDGKASVVIFPVQIVGAGADRAAAESLKSLIDGEGLFGSTAVGDEVSFEIKPGSNEQRRLWDLAEAVRAHLRANPAGADYALLAEYMMTADKGKAHTVHFVLCDGQGQWVIVDFQNEHHPTFQSVDPKTAEDCGKLVKRRLAELLK